MKQATKGVWLEREFELEWQLCQVLRGKQIKTGCYF
jgi:hypothetical protein